MIFAWFVYASVIGTMVLFPQRIVDAWDKAIAITITVLLSIMLWGASKSCEE